MVLFDSACYSDLYCYADKFMKVLDDVKSNFKMITWYTIMLILMNIALSWVPSFFGSQDVQVNNSVSISVLLLSGVFAPFFEETIMRGLLQRWLEINTQISLWSVYGIVASIFSLLHFQYYFVPFFFTSVVLSYVYDQSQHKLVVPFLIHCFYNIVVIVISAFNL
ncbi:CPBP family intramembrane glutamic endopeptidase [Candidatus Enterococcus courvalinii]